jgi:hypothetical protein
LLRSYLSEVEYRCYIEAAAPVRQASFLKEAAGSQEFK